MRPIDWLLSHLDEPDVTEVVLGLGRPAAVRSLEGFRPITSMAFDRAEIETLVAGTPMSGLIGSPVSLPATEVELDDRRLVVEVLRQGPDAAMRIALAPGSQRGRKSTPPATRTPAPAPESTYSPALEPEAPPPPDDVRTRFKPTIPPRTITPTTPPRTMTPTTPPRTMTPTVPPRTMTPTVPPETLTTPAPRTASTTVPPRSMTPTVSPRTASPTMSPRTETPTSPPPAADSSGPVPRRMTPTMPPIIGRTTTATRPARSTKRTVPPYTPAADVAPPAPMPTAEVYEPDFAAVPNALEIDHSAPAYREGPPLEFGDEYDFAAPQVDNIANSARHVLPGGDGGEIDEVGEATYGYEDDQLAGTGGDLGAAQWYGPQIIDEHADIGALRSLLEAARRRGASDLHVIAGQPVAIRRLGELAALDVNALVQPYDNAVHSALFGPLDATTADRFLLPLLGPSARQKLEEVGYVDLGFVVPGRGRVRANISRQQDGLAGTFRLARDTIPTLDELGLPRELAKIVRHHQGLVVIAGPSGHGKTTTMAALVDLLNTSNSDHIITIEDPVEIEHPPKKAIVSHREVGRHTLSFVQALKASLREDPDVIVIGELRDRETVEIALTAAETGHLVLSTISTPSAVKTIDRLIDMFPPDDQVQVRASISGTLRAVIAQRLLPNATRDGMVAAIELVTGVLPLATMIRENKLFQLPSLMQRGRAFGMIRLDDSLAEHVKAKRLTDVVALAAAENKRELAAQISGRPSQPTNPRGLFGGKP